MTDVYLNGRFLPKEEACVPVMDRGFLFGDGVYEVLPVFGGHMFRLEQHIQRLANSLESIRLPNPMSVDEWSTCLAELIDRNGGGDLSLYIQVTRGVVEKRDHVFAGETDPTVFAMANVVESGDKQPVAAVTLEDIRWKRCDIKAITLLPNVLLRQQANDAGAYEAILVEDGFVKEGAATNVFTVSDGVIATPPLEAGILPGITRDVILEIMTAQGLKGSAKVISVADLKAADEIWLTSSVKELVPVGKLDGQLVGDGSPGPEFTRMVTLYEDFKSAQRV